MFIHWLDFAREATSDEWRRPKLLHVGRGRDAPEAAEAGVPRDETSS